MYCRHAADNPKISRKIPSKIMNPGEVVVPALNYDVWFSLKVKDNLALAFGAGPVMSQP